jgi:hypothetical protein
MAAATLEKLAVKRYEEVHRPATIFLDNAPPFLLSFQPKREDIPSLVLYLGENQELSRLELNLGLPLANEIRTQIYAGKKADVQYSFIGKGPSKPKVIHLGNLVTLASVFDPAIHWINGRIAIEDSPTYAFNGILFYDTDAQGNTLKVPYCALRRLVTQ